MHPQLTVAQGSILGEQRTTCDGVKYYSFEGIPYAKPPIGKLRFRDPQPPESWSSIRDCTKPGNKCAQINIWAKKGFEGSEDCLYLNVYTPSLPSEKLEKLPVIFFTHGGRLMFGYGDYYQPDYFLRHNVILVTYNYRLNILGFLSLDIPEVPGNAGLKDSAAALKWVNSNIANFNGDPGNVTVFGESAGAAVATSFLCSQMTTGLFHKVIAQSGVLTCDPFMCIQDHVAEAGRVARNMGKDIKDKHELLDFFENAPIEDLVFGFMTTENKRVLHPVLMPVVEKEFPGVERYIHEPLIQSFLHNRYAKVPIMIGWSSYDGAFFVYKNSKGRIVYNKNLNDYIPHFLYLKDDDPKRTKIVNSLKEYYFKGAEIGDETLVEYIQMLSDAFFDRDATNFTEIVARTNSECYAYRFHYVGNLNISIMKNLGVHGTTHGDPMQYQFYRKSLAAKATEKDKRVIEYFMEAFTNFAKTRKPSWSNNKLNWVPYTTEEKLTLRVDEELSMETSQSWKNCQFWNSICDIRNKL